MYAVTQELHDTTDDDVL